MKFENLKPGDLIWANRIYVNEVICTVYPSCDAVMFLAEIDAAGGPYVIAAPIMQEDAAGAELDWQAKVTANDMQCDLMVYRSGDCWLTEEDADAAVHAFIDHENAIVDEINAIIDEINARHAEDPDPEDGEEPLSHYVLNEPKVIPVPLDER